MSFPVHDPDMDQKDPRSRYGSESHRSVSFPVNERSLRRSCCLSRRSSEPSFRRSCCRSRRSSVIPRPRSRYGSERSSERSLRRSCCLSRRSSEPSHRRSCCRSRRSSVISRPRSRYGSERSSVASDDPVVYQEDPVNLDRRSCCRSRRSSVIPRPDPDMDQKDPVNVASDVLSIKKIQ